MSYFSYKRPVPGEHVNIGGWPSGRLPLACSVKGRSAPAGGVRWLGQPWWHAGEQRGGLPGRALGCGGRTHFGTAQKRPPLVPEGEETWVKRAQTMSNLTLTSGVCMSWCQPGRSVPSSSGVSPGAGACWYLCPLPSPVAKLGLGPPPAPLSSLLRQTAWGSAGPRPEHCSPLPTALYLNGSADS